MTAAYYPDGGEWMGVPPGDVVFLDDVQENVDAAVAFGLRGLRHRTTAASIEAINSLIAGI